MRGALLLGMALLVGGSAGAAQGDGSASDRQAETWMEAMLAAMGGPKWLAVANVQIEGRTTSFYHGLPTGMIGDFRLLRTVPTGADAPGLTRTEFSKQRDVVSLLLAHEAWEITYKGKRQLAQQEYGAAFLRRDHSLDEAVRVWWHAPGTLLMSQGQKMVDRHLVDEVSMLSADNDNITLDMDADDHLPVRVSFAWRDPEYKDQNEDATEYADYHLVDGLPTAFNLTSYHNGDMTAEQYLSKVSYNIAVPAGAFDVNATAARLKK